MELTLALLKPHVVKQHFAAQQIRKIIETCFKVIYHQSIIFNQNLAERFYEEHKGKFFYNRLVTQMNSGPAEAYILAEENAITKWRTIMGPTKFYKTQYTHPDSLRGLYGLSDTRNATHGADSRESVYREVSLLFPEFSIDKWYQDELKYNDNKVFS